MQIIGLCTAQTIGQLIAFRVIQGVGGGMLTPVGLFSIASFLGVTFVMPLYLQLLREMTPLTSGLTTFPQAYGIMASSLVAGRLYARIGPRRLMTGGCLTRSRRR